MSWRLRRAPLAAASCVGDRRARLSFWSAARAFCCAVRWFRRGRVCRCRVRMGGTCGRQSRCSWNTWSVGWAERRWRNSVCREWPCSVGGFAGANGSRCPRSVATGSAGVGVAGIADDSTAGAGPGGGSGVGGVAGKWHAPARWGGLRGPEKGVRFNCCKSAHNGWSAATAISDIKALR